jgi:hypothetical protein
MKNNNKSIKAVALSKKSWGLAKRMERRNISGKRNKK